MSHWPAAVKKGGRIWLGHADLARSVRPYPSVADIWRMIARTAYVQLRFSLLLLLATTLAMALIWLVPPAAALFGHGRAFWCGLLAWMMLSASFLPTLRRFGRSPLWAPFLPLIAGFYMAATIGIGREPLSRPRRGLEGTCLSEECRMTDADAAGDPNVETWSGKGRHDENFPVGSRLIARRYREPMHGSTRSPATPTTSPTRRTCPPQDKVARLDVMEEVLLGRSGVGVAQRAGIAHQPG